MRKIGLSVLMFLFVGIFIFYSSSVQALTPCTTTNLYCIEQYISLVQGYNLTNSCTLQDLINLNTKIQTTHVSCYNGAPKHYNNGALMINYSSSNYAQTNENGTTTAIKNDIFKLSNVNKTFKFFGESANTYIKLIMSLILIIGLIFITYSKTQNMIYTIFAGLIAVIISTVMGLISIGILIIMLVVLLLLTILGFTYFKGA